MRSVVAGRLIDKSSGTVCELSWHFYLRRPVSLIDQQEFVPSGSPEGLNFDRRISRTFRFHEFVSRSEIVLQQFQHPEPGVRLAICPINHRDARELRGIAHQLRLTCYVDTDLR